MLSRTIFAPAPPSQRLRPPSMTKGVGPAGGLRAQGGAEVPAACGQRPPPRTSVLFRDTATPNRILDPDPGEQGGARLPRPHFPTAYLVQVLLSATGLLLQLLPHHPPMAFPATRMLGPAPLPTQGPASRHTHVVCGAPPLDAPEDSLASSSSRTPSPLGSQPRGWRFLTRVEHMLPLLLTRGPRSPAAPHLPPE